MLRFYHRHLGLEEFIGIGLLLAAFGLTLDVLIAFVTFHSISRLDLAAIAQALIIVGANVGLVGALSSLLEGDQGQV